MIGVYVAGASSERAERAGPVSRALEKAGYQITHDWTKAVDMHGANNEHGSLSAEEMSSCARDDYEGVQIADIFVLLAPQKPSTGAWAELGIALAYGCRIFIAGPCDKCIFTWLPECRKFDTDEDLVRYMTEEA